MARILPWTNVPSNPSDLMDGWAQDLSDIVEFLVYRVMRFPGNVDDTMYIVVLENRIPVWNEFRSFGMSWVT